MKIIYLVDTKEKYDLIIGNPPWIVINSINSDHLQGKTEKFSKINANINRYAKCKQFRSFLPLSQKNNLSSYENR